MTRREFVVIALLAVAVMVAGIAVMWIIAPVQP